MNEELARCAQVNFENLERTFPMIKNHLLYRVAKAQLDEALGGMPVDESLDLLARQIKASWANYER